MQRSESHFTASYPFFFTSNPLLHSGWSCTRLHHAWITWGKCNQVMGLWWESLCTSLHPLSSQHSLAPDDPIETCWSTKWPFSSGPLIKRKQMPCLTYHDIRDDQHLSNAHMTFQSQGHIRPTHNFLLALRACTYPTNCVFFFFVHPLATYRPLAHKHPNTHRRTHLPHNGTDMVLIPMPHTIIRTDFVRRVDGNRNILTSQ